MHKYDLLVIGSGAGANVAANAYETGMTVALVDNERFGGTCLLRGCIPTKILTRVADLIMEVKGAGRVDLKARIDGVDFASLMDRMRAETVGESEKIEESVAHASGYDFYRGTGEFVSDLTMTVNGETIKADHVVIASGARPYIPPIDGLDAVEYLTNKTVLEIKEIPKSMIIVGGGYIAVEFAHFFSAIGTDVTILGRNVRLLKEEDSDVSALLQAELSKRMKVYTNCEVVSARESGGLERVTARNRSSGEELTFAAETLLIAAGRISNADLFKPEKTGIKTDAQGWITVDEYFRTSNRHIWAFGDALGQHMFRHVANDQSQIVWLNLRSSMETPKKAKLYSMSYHAVPRAIFSWPQIATVGMTLAEARNSGRHLLVGTADYSDTAKGVAMGRPPGFARIVADADSQEILGATIVGPEAPTLVQEVIDLMYTPGRSYVPALQAMHIHPALPEVVQRAFAGLAPIGHEHHHSNHPH